jgi:hypothetical protein
MVLNAAGEIGPLIPPVVQRAIDRNGRTFAQFLAHIITKSPELEFNHQTFERLQELFIESCEPKRKPPRSVR